MSHGSGGGGTHLTESSYFVRTVRAMTSASLRRRVAVLVITLGLSGATVGAAHAGDDDGPLRDRLRVACLRIPAISDRVNTVVTRLTAAADVRGSIAWLEVRIADAEANNHPRVAEDLRNRLAIVQARLTVVQDRQTRLAALTERCRELGVAV